MREKIFQFVIKDFEKENQLMQHDIHISNGPLLILSTQTESSQKKICYIQHNYEVLKYSLTKLTAIQSRLNFKRLINSI